MSVILEIVRAVLGRNAVRSVDYERLTNIDGEEILSIRVQYDGDLGKLSSYDMQAIVTQVWEAERRSGTAGFPIIDFVSDTDTTENYAAE